MSGFLMPITLLVKHYLPFDNQYLSQLPLYLFISRVLIIQNYTYAFHKFGHTQTKQRPSRISNREEAAQRKNGERTK